MSTVTSSDGTTIGYTRTGEGPAIILVDGALCSRNFGPMGELAGLLAPHLTVYTYDRRGRGESGDTQPYAVEREIEDIAALIDAAGGSAGIHGISSGAALALKAASRLPAITKVSGYEAPLTVDDSNPPKVDAYLSRLTATLAEGRRGDAVELFMRLVGTPQEAIEPMRQSPMWAALEAVAPTLRYDALLVENPQYGKALPSDFAEQLGGLKTPALVMAGGASPEWMRTTAKTIAQAIPSGQYRSLEGQTHEVASQAIAPILIEFFA
ncbi:MAG TPA: alpha/beta hydrolase [Ktedonobacterales bacterium]